jgi:hypothetical protein
MRIVAYVVGVFLGALGWLTALLALLSVEPWLALGWVLVLAEVLLAYLTTSPTYWGDHGRRGPRARQDSRGRPGGADGTHTKPWA